MNSVCLAAKPASYAAAPRPLSAWAAPQSPAVLWRPWLRSSDPRAACRRSRLACPYSRPAAPGVADGKAQSFQHPVRLFWPKSKSFDYLYSDGEALLRNFPVQATINFYEESDSEEEEDEEEPEEDEMRQSDSQSEQCVKASPRFTSYN
ncbi:protein ripply1 [Denticeps clupeoides]|uniref:Ripply transcriptional repressor 1 n=1 Tax=Denticeps clupeoides TaxID=299321 RepID=A0AAY4EA33_9TELE|nr:protein ripply1 [Denticeps clupeoides]